MNRRDILFGLTTVIIWGLNFSAIKLGLGNMPPLMLLTIRFIVACLPAIFFFAPAAGSVALDDCTGIDHERW